MGSEWLIVYLDEYLEILVLDTSAKLSETRYTDGDGFTIYRPPVMTIPGVYRISNIKISGGGLNGVEDPEWDNPEVSGDWTLISTWEHKERV